VCGRVSVGVYRLIRRFGLASRVRAGG